MLAGDSARERVVETLKGAYADGRLTYEEFQDRTDLAYRARSYDELDRLTGDLPRDLPPAFRPAPPPRTNGGAVASLVCGVLGTVTFGVTAIPAVVLGHLARREIRRTGEQGDGMAIGGIVLGWLMIVAVVGAVVVGLMLFNVVSDAVRHPR